MVNTRGVRMARWLGTLMAVAWLAPGAQAAEGRATTVPMVTMKVREVRTDRGSPVVLLEHGRSVIPIYIGTAEAQAIQMRLNQQKAVRPLTHDLLETMLLVMGARIERVEVDDLRDNIFFGKVTLKDAKGRRYRIDGRPSDLIALAVGAKLSIQVATHVLRKAGVDAATWATPTPPQPPTY